MGKDDDGMGSHRPDLTSDLLYKLQKETVVIAGQDKAGKGSGKERVKNFFLPTSISGLYYYFGCSRVCHLAYQERSYHIIANTFSTMIHGFTVHCI